MNCEKDFANKMPLPRKTVVTLISVLSYISLLPGGSCAIDCFKCVSINYNNPACDDPFHNNHSRALLESPCMGGRKGRDGVFPATACIKMAGIDETGQHITVRGCALDSGTLTTDTEIIRMSHCGGFYFEDKYVRGCLQSCDDADACNGAPGSAGFYGSAVLRNLISALLIYVVGTMSAR